MTKRILCATDFSEDAYVAIKYAANLAVDMKAELVLFHAYHNYAPAISSGRELILEQPIVTDRRPHINQKMRQIQARMRILHPRLPISYQIVESDLISGIRHYDEQFPVSLVVMGARGDNDLKEALFGGTALDAMRDLYCPTLAIPLTAIYTRPAQIVYAADLEEKDIEVSRKLVELFGSFGVSVYLAHFFPEASKELQESADEFKKSLFKKINYPGIHTSSKTYGDLAGFIDAEITKRSADILVMREREHGFFLDLFHKDLVKKYIQHAQLPLLVFNDRCFD